MDGGSGGQVVVSEVASPILRRFAHLEAHRVDALFEQAPEPLRAVSNPRVFAAALGAVVYCPATQAQAPERLLTGYWPAVTAMVFCLEDSIAHRDLDDAERRITCTLAQVRDRVELAGTRAGVPFIFVRPRSSEHLERLLEAWGDLAHELDGLMLPKIGATTAEDYLRIVASAQAGRDRPLWGLPIIEGKDVALRESRPEALLALRATLRKHRAIAPAVRIGATDLSGLWGLRRPRDFTVYDLAVVRDVIADVVNIIGRDPDGPLISGPVWEYFNEAAVFKPPLRETPFSVAFGPEPGRILRQKMMSLAIDGLLRETLLDRANGLHGKTVIHPCHAGAVDAAYAVSHEEWLSAVAVQDGLANGSVTSASTGGRMNEPRPHRLWAERTLMRARMFGVLRRDFSFLALLEGAQVVC